LAPGQWPARTYQSRDHTYSQALFEQIAELWRTIAAQAEEIARLKGGPRRPNIKPRAMEKATEPKPDKPAGEGGGKRGDTKSKLTIHEEKIVKADAPAGSRFKGYTSFVVQDLMVRAHVTNFRCERWQTLDGTVVTASLPAGIDGHFGRQLRRFVLALYDQGQMTSPLSGIRGGRDMLGADALAQVSSYCAISAVLESYSAIASLPYLRHRERSLCYGNQPVPIYKCSCCDRYNHFLRFLVPRRRLSLKADPITSQAVSRHAQVDGPSSPASPSSLLGANRQPVAPQPITGGVRGQGNALRQVGVRRCVARSYPATI
jgi:hypothetical protein